MGSNQGLNESWCVLNDGGELFWQVVVGYLNPRLPYPQKFTTNYEGMYYGLGKEGRYYCSSYAGFFDCILTLYEFRLSLTTQTEMR